MKAIAGNAGPKVRSDCQASIEIKKSGGLKILINSKVKALYGDQIFKLCKKILDFYEIKNAEFVLEDSGAVDFVIAARVESAVKQVVKTTKEYLPEILKQNQYSTSKDQFRFSRLYLPGNDPKMMLNAGIHKPHGIILDLEDSVAPAKKDEARFVVRNALRQIDFFGAERMIRINQGERGLEDFRMLVPHYVNLVLIPKCESADYILCLDKELDKIRKERKIKYPVYYMPIIESALGVENAFEIARSSQNVAALAIGLEDFTADLGVRRTTEAFESLYARTRMINACKAAGIQAIDSVFSDVADMDGLKKTIKLSRSLGFEGMGCIHPRQIETIHKCYSPEKEEIDKAKKIVKAFDEAKSKGLGVVSLGTKMIDPPVVKRALKTIDLAVKLDIISKEWRTEDGQN